MELYAKYEDIWNRALDFKETHSDYTIIYWDHSYHELTDTIGFGAIISPFSSAPPHPVWKVFATAYETWYNDNLDYFRNSRKGYIYHHKTDYAIIRQSHANAINQLVKIEDWYEWRLISDVHLI